MTKKDKFQETALALIHKKGFKAMTIRQLALEMHCDVKNIYNYTSSKSAILEDLLKGVSRDFHTGIDQILNADLNPVQQMEELIRLHVEISYQKPLQVALLINEWRNLSETEIVKFKKRRTEYEEKVGLILERGVNEKHFRPLNTKITVQGIIGSLRWQYEYYFRKDKQINPLDTLEELKQLIIGGLVKK